MLSFLILNAAAATDTKLVCLLSAWQPALETHGKTAAVHAIALLIEPRQGKQASRQHRIYFTL